jgi:hypothetical protein
VLRAALLTGIVSLSHVLLSPVLLPASRALAQYEPVRSEGVAALVGGPSARPGVAVILRSDIYLRARITLSRESSEPPTGPLPSPLLAAALEEVIGEVLIEREADRLRAARPSEAEIDRERRRLERQAGGAERLEALLAAEAIAREEIEAIARRRAYAGAFLRANLEGNATVSDAQVERVYESGAHPFAGRPIDDVREPLRLWIAQRVLRRDVRRWIEVLRSRTTVRVVAPWRRPGPDVGDGGGDDGG